MGTLDLARLLAQVVAILVVARGLHVALGRRLGQPLVVSEIAAGVLLGPSVLGAWLPTSHGWLFAPSSLATLETVSTLGVLLFAFLVGLEVDPAMLRGRVRVPVAIGLGSFLVPAIGGVVAGWLAHDAYAVGTPPALFATFVGVAIGVSAFPVLARFLVEHRLLGTELGAIAMASAATADFLAWSALAVLVALVRVAEWPSALTMWLAAAALGVALALIRPLLLRLDRASDTAHDAAVVGAVVLVFAGVAAAEALGLHGLLVAFVAGALVPRSRIADGLIDRLESLVVLVLLPLFFASSGLRTDLGTLGTNLPLLAVLGVVAVVTKIGGTLVAARGSGLVTRDALRLGVLLNARGLFGLIVVNVGLSVGILSPPVFTVLVALAWLTTAITSPLLHLVTRVWPEPTEPSTDRPPSREPGGLLLWIDDPGVLRGQAVLAATFARAAKTEITALHLREPREAPSVRAPSSPRLTHELESIASSLGFEVRGLGFVSTDPVEDLLQQAEAKGSSWILLAPHARFFERGLGAAVHEVRRRAKSSVAVLTHGDRLERVERVLVVRCGPEDDALAFGEVARRAGADVDVLEIDARDRPIERILERVDTGSYHLVVVAFARAFGLASTFAAAPLLERVAVPLLVVRSSEAHANEEGS